MKHGEEKLTTPAGASLYYQSWMPDKKLIICEGLYHEIFNEPEQEDVMTDVANWLVPRLEHSAAA